MIIELVILSYDVTSSSLGYKKKNHWLDAD